MAGGWLAGRGRLEAGWPWGGTQPTSWASFARRGSNMGVTARLGRAGLPYSGRGALAVGRHSADVLSKLGQAALEHGDHGRPGLGGPLIFEQGGDLGNAENPQPGAERGDGELVVVGQWQPTLLCYVRSGRLVRC